MTLALQLHTLEPDMAAAWQIEFDHPSVTIAVSDILEAKADAILSPANSFGFMDGGIDRVYSQFFGWELQERLQSLLSERFQGELPVGQAVVLPTHHKSIPHLVSAPTMRVPQVIERTVNVYLAFRAALIAIRQFNGSNGSPIRSLACPAMGAGIGGMPFRRVARQMFAAYATVELGDTAWLGSARGVLRHHASLLE